MLPRKRLENYNLFTRKSEMSRKRKDLYYGLPGSKAGSRQRRVRNILLAIVFGAGAGGVLGALMFFKSRL
jgi:hypothetical protein